MAHIFISYSKKNQLYARSLADKLKQESFDVWIDDRIDYGKLWEREIFKAIDECGAFIVIMTPESYESEWVLRECQYADRRKKPQFPLLLSGDEFPRYGPRQYVDVRSGELPPSDFYSKLEKYATRKSSPGVDINEQTSDANAVIDTQAHIAIANPPPPDENKIPVEQAQTEKRPKLRNGFIVTVLAIIVLAAAISLVSQFVSGNNQLIPTRGPTLDTPGMAAVAQSQTATPTSEPSNINIPTDTPTHTTTPDETQTAQVFIAATQEQATRLAIANTLAFETAVALIAQDAAQQTATAETWTETPTRIPLGGGRSTFVVPPTATPTANPTFTTTPATDQPNLNPPSVSDSEQILDPAWLGVIFSRNGGRVKVHVSANANTPVVREVSNGQIVSASRQRGNWYFVGGGWVLDSFIQFGNTQATVQALVTVVLSYTPPASATATNTQTPTATRTPTPTRTPTITSSPTPTLMATRKATLTPSHPDALVNSQGITVISPTPTLTPIPTFAPSPCTSTEIITYLNPPRHGFIFMDIGQGAWVRCGPGENYQQLRLIEIKTEVEISAVSQGWYFIGDGWVRSDLIRSVENAAAATALVQTVAAKTPVPLPTDTPTDTPIPSPTDTPDQGGGNNSNPGGGGGGVTLVSVSGGAFNTSTKSCEATVTVSGGSATGHFHVWNNGYDDNGYPTQTISGGNTYHVSFGGYRSNPNEEQHWVTFVYDGRETSPVTGSCSGWSPQG